jgi:hypothetical protein
MRSAGLSTSVALLASWHSSASAATFAVDDLGDGVDASPGNGVCAAARGTCILRAAIREANALVGADQVALAVGVHELTIRGENENEDDAAKGDLDRPIATFPIADGRFRGHAAQRPRQWVARCTHAGCPAVALIPKPKRGRPG